MSSGTRWTIVGQGLAGTCLAWSFWKRGIDFLIVDQGTGGSSRVAAGMINPITGKNFEPSWRIGEFLPAAVACYHEVEQLIDRKIWYPHPVLRLAGSEKEWNKIVSKLESPDVVPWVTSEVPAPDGWSGAVELRGGGRLDTRAFLEGSRAFFEKLSCYEERFFDSMEDKETLVRCEGAAGLMSGDYGEHRCAKGEILTIRATGWDEDRIRIGGGGWMVPQGGGLFRVGSTYEWNELDELPTAKGKLRVEQIAARLGGDVFEVVGHDAGIRPILRRSQPLIGPMPEGGWMFNALGSKGSLYAPAMAEKLGDWLVDGNPPEPEVDFRYFLKQTGADDSV